MKPSFSWNMRKARNAAFFMLAATVPGIAEAQDAACEAWPERAITVIVGWPPGGGTDILARTLAEHLTEVLGQPVVVNNRPGAGGVVGAQYVGQASPDGYTLVFAGDAELTIAPVVRGDVSDPMDNLAPISLVSSGPFMVVANPDFPPNRLDELVAYAEENPGAVSYGSFGVGTIGHMLGEHFKHMTGIDTLHVPYQGSAPAMVDLVGGRIDYAYASPMAVMEMIEAGRLKGIAMLSPERLGIAEDVPTSAEAGVEGAEGGPRFGLLAPAGTPECVIDELHQAVVTAPDSPEVRGFFESQGHQMIANTPEEYGEFMQQQTKQWQDIADAIGLEMQ